MQDPMELYEEKLNDTDGGLAAIIHYHDEKNPHYEFTPYISKGERRTLEDARRVLATLSSRHYSPESA